MKIILLAIYYPPIFNSAAVQLGDLVDGMKKDFEEILIITPSPMKSNIYVKENIKIFRIRYPNLLNKKNYVRALLEIFLPFYLFLKLKISTIKIGEFNGILWWSPSIFLTPFVHLIKINNNKVKSLLILRDIFPQWMIDLGSIKNKFIIYFFRLFETYQNKIADKIGIQSDCNKKYFTRFNKKVIDKIHILPNWIKIKKVVKNFEIEKRFENFDKFKNIGIYTGNIGLAQGLSNFKKLFNVIKNSNKICLIIIGRGSSYTSLKDWCFKLNINNVFFLAELDSRFMPLIYQKADFGIISLDYRHTTNNIPGKYISYINYGLPVLALINKGNSLNQEINSEKLGLALANSSKISLNKYIEKFIYQIENNYFNISKIKKFGFDKYNNKKISKIIKDLFLEN